MQIQNDEKFEYEEDVEDPAAKKGDKNVPVPGKSDELKEVMMTSSETVSETVREALRNEVAKLEHLTTIRPMINNLCLRMRLNDFCLSLRVSSGMVVTML